MCGILFLKSAKNKVNFSHDKIDKIEKLQKRRGPDNFKKIFYKKNNTLCYFRRLSIIDLNHRSNQPFEIGNLTIMLNGEIYNYKELKKKFLYDEILETTSDTEVVLRLFKRYGAKIFKELSGMYSIVILDRENNYTYAFRDPFGIKPLYIYNVNSELILSSLFSVIENLKKEDLSINNDSEVIYSFYGNILGNYTSKKEIQIIEPGVLYTFNQNNFVTKKILEDIYSKDYFLKDTCLEETHNSLKESIVENCEADVPISIMFSSGYDSNIIAENIKDKKNSFLFTLGVESEKNNISNEIPFSKRLSEIHKVKHSSIYLSDESIKETFKHFYKDIEQPTVDGFNNYLISNIIQNENFKVALSGIGGDEYFGTYNTFKIVPLIIILGKVLKLFKFNELFEKLAALLGFTKLSQFNTYAQTIELAYFFKRSISQKSLNHKKIISALENCGFLNEIIELSNSKTNLKTKISLLELKYYCKDRLLKDSDWTSMSNSLELRVPFLNKDFHKNICSLNFSKCNITKQNMICNNNLLIELSKIKKKGFYIPYYKIKNDELLKISANEYKNEIHNKFF